MSHSRRFLVALVALSVAMAGVVAGGSPASAAASGAGAGSVAGTGLGPTRPGAPQPSQPGRYLLSLGDSIAFGYQSRKVSTELASGAYSPDHFPGYIAPLEADISGVVQHPQRVVNYACPGETTASMITGPCAFAVNVHAAGYRRALHDDYTGAQLAAGVAFLRAHRGEVSPITLSIGANDLNNLFNTCQQSVACVQANLPATLTTLAANLAVTLGALRVAAPRAQIIVLTPYNPAYVIAPSSDALLTVSNRVIGTVALAARARVADGFTAINLALPGQELASVCTFTLMCTQSDIHPSDAGYLRLADALWTASGYARLTGRRAA
jgi:lysophospholipase L1-like esterase